MFLQGLLKGEVHCTIDLLFDLFGLVCFANKNKNCQLSYNWFQTSQTGSLWYSDTSPSSTPWSETGFGTYFVVLLKPKIVSCHTADSKPVKQEVDGTVMLSPLVVFPDSSIGRAVSTTSTTAMTATGAGFRPTSTRTESRDRRHKSVRRCRWRSKLVRSSW